MIMYKSFQEIIHYMWNSEPRIEKVIIISPELSKQGQGTMNERQGNESEKGHTNCLTWGLTPSNDRGDIIGILQILFLLLGAIIVYSMPQYLRTG